MDTGSAFFYFFSVMAIGFSLFVVLRSSPVASAFGLVVVFFNLAGIYALLGAHLIAGLQILVYAGAVMVLFAFIIMLLGGDVPSFDLGRTHWLSGGLLGTGLMAIGVMTVWALKNTTYSGAKGFFIRAVILENGGNTKVLSNVMFSKYILPFELTSVLLLAPIVGSVVIAMRKQKLEMGTKGDSK